MRATILAFTTMTVVCAFPVMGQGVAARDGATTGELIPGGLEEFTTYFEAEIEVEMDLDPVLTIVSGEVQAGGATITILLMPDVWFRRADGTVWNLADLQDELVEFELEIEDGFKLEIEIDDDD